MTTDDFDRWADWFTKKLINLVRHDLDHHTRDLPADSSIDRGSAMRTETRITYQTAANFRAALVPDMPVAEFDLLVRDALLELYREIEVALKQREADGYEQGFRDGEDGVVP